MSVGSRIRVTAAWVLSAFTLWLPALASAQSPSLADLAKKEQERRKEIKAPGRVYTNKDAKAAPPPATPTAPAPPAAAGEQKPAEVPKPADEQKDEAWWRTRMSNAREELRRNEMALEAFQTRVNSLSADFVNRDDPYQRAQISIDRQKTLAELERVKTEIERIKKQIADIEEEARQAGVPPGWLR